MEDAVSYARRTGETLIAATKRILAEATPRGGASMNEIVDALWGTDKNGGPDNAEGVVRQIMHELRKKHDVRIISQVKYRLADRREQ